MDQRIWGPGTWLFLHSVTLNYPKNPTIHDKEQVIKFFNIVGQMLPCRYCRENFERHLRRYPIRADSRETLIVWLIDVHNLVNIHLNKPVLSREEAMEKITAVYRKETQNPCSIHLLYTGLGLLFIFACFCHLYKR